MCRSMRSSKGFGRSLTPHGRATLVPVEKVDKLFPEQRAGAGAVRVEPDEVSAARNRVKFSMSAAQTAIGLRERRAVTRHSDDIRSTLDEQCGHCTRRWVDQGVSEDYWHRRVWVRRIGTTGP